jgi:hypothetical protein
MGADAISLSIGIAVGMLLLVTYLAVNATALAQRALRNHGQVEFEVKSRLLSARLKATGASPRITYGEGPSAAQEPETTAKARSLQRRS